jgi:hypothetical protein
MSTDDLDEMLTITEAARATRTHRGLIRRLLKDGQFSGAHKDAQGFWRVPSSDLLQAGLTIAPDQETAATAAEITQLRLDLADMRRRAEHAEALLAVERQRAFDLARALELARASVSAVTRAVVAPPTPAPRESTHRSRRSQPSRRGNWQAAYRAARQRESAARAERERDAPTAADESESQLS